MATNTKKHSIYILDHEKAIESLFKEELDAGRLPESISLSEIVKAIMRKNDGYKKQVLKLSSYNDYQIELYYKQDPPRLSPLANFCSSFADASAAVCSSKMSFDSSVMFVWKDQNLFMIPTGQGYHAIEDYLFTRFGIIIAYRYHKVMGIRSSDGNRISSTIHSDNLVYSRDIRFNEMDSLDTVYKSLMGRIKDKDLVAHLLGLPKKSKRDQLTVNAKDSICFGSKMGFEDLMRILQLLDMDYSDAIDHINSITKLDSRKDKALVKELKARVFKEIGRSLADNACIGFDIFNKETYYFLSADSYEINFGNRDLLDTFPDIDLMQWSTALASGYKRHVIEGNVSTENYLEGIVIIAKSENGADQTRGRLLSHLSGEVEDESGNHYFLLYGEFYRLEKSYNDRLQKALGSRLAEHLGTNLSTSWPSGINENEYNELAEDKANGVYMFHLRKPEGVEFADHLVFEEDDYKVVHVKDGFDSYMRDLDRQVQLSIIKLKDLKSGTGEDYFRKLYDMAVDKGHMPLDLFPDSGSFIEYLRTKTPHYGIIIRPKESADLLQSRSNIAKYCLFSTLMFCAREDIDFKIQVESNF